MNFNKILNAMSDLNKIARQYFDNYPKVDIFLVTSDGQFFTDANRSAAYDHQSRINPGEKPNVIRRGNVEASVTNHSATKDDPSSPEATKGEPDDTWTVKELKAYLDDNQVDYDSKANKAELLSFAKASASGTPADKSEGDPSSPEATKDEDENTKSE
jgi:hypothetical protein